MSRGVFPAVAAASGLLALALPAGAAAEPGCMGGTFTTLTVHPRDGLLGFCGHVLGNVTVVKGADFATVAGARIDGNLIAQPGAKSLDIEGTTIGGSFYSSGGVGDGGPLSFAVGLCHDTIGGSVNVSNATSLVAIADRDEACHAGGNRIGGALRLTNNIAGLEVADNTVRGSATITGNQYSFDSIEALIDPQPTGCDGKGGPCTNAAEVGHNVINGSLFCFGNPNGIFQDEGPNLVHGLTTGQCLNEGTQK